MEGIRGRRDNEQFWGKRETILIEIVRKMQDFQLDVKKVQKLKWAVLTQTLQRKVIICALTEQGTNKKKQHVIQDSTWCYDLIFFFMTCISFWEENTNQMKMQFVKLFSSFMCKHINIALFCWLLMESSCNVCIELEELVFAIIDMPIYNPNFMSH